MLKKENEQNDFYPEFFKQGTEVVFDFGEDFGQISKIDISKMFVEIHAVVCDPVINGCPK